MHSFIGLLGVTFLGFVSVVGVGRSLVFSCGDVLPREESGFLRGFAAAVSLYFAWFLCYFYMRGICFHGLEFGVFIY